MLICRSNVQFQKKEMDLNYPFYQTNGSFSDINIIPSTPSLIILTTSLKEVLRILYCTSGTKRVFPVWRLRKKPVVTWPRISSLLCKEGGVGLEMTKLGKEDMGFWRRVSNWNLLKKLQSSGRAALYTPVTFLGLGSMKEVRYVSDHTDLGKNIYRRKLFLNIELLTQEYSNFIFVIST